MRSSDRSAVRSPSVWYSPTGHRRDRPAWRGDRAPPPGSRTPASRAAPSWPASESFAARPGTPRSAPGAAPSDRRPLRRPTPLRRRRGRRTMERCRGGPRRLRAGLRPARPWDRRARPPAVPPPPRRRPRPSGVAARGGRARPLTRETVKQAEELQLGQRGAGPGVALARGLQVAALAVQVPLFLQDVGEQPLQPPLLGDLARVAEQRRGAGVVGLTRRDARQVQVGGALLRPQAPVIRARQDAEALRGAPEIAGHGARQS